MEGDDMRADTQWHLDKRVPLALIAALLLQTFGAAWWASSISARVESLERRVDAAAPLSDRMTRVEVKLETVQTGIEEIKRLISAKK